ncbi:MAG TPA: cytidine deaminase, partial [Candidatus Cloacimonadota bacterium]|nr:cytidine deaminase [Candidatus Cloacimonadota bacterium]
MDKRPSWHEYFMQMAYLAAKRSTCLRRTVGAALVRDNQLISTGYNGSPKHSPHCAEVGCLREQQNVPSGQKHELCRGVHAEQ